MLLNIARAMLRVRRRNYLRGAEGCAILAVATMDASGPLRPLLPAELAYCRERTRRLGFGAAVRELGWMALGIGASTSAFLVAVLFGYYLDPLHMGILGGLLGYIGGEKSRKAS
ncbi:MAG: hypothetical protein HY553_18400 [Elusimicrobia bacterium]|nr:hypothetical protein [Elusimicrobiota bacterium]